MMTVFSSWPILFTAAIILAARWKAAPELRLRRTLWLLFMLWLAWGILGVTAWFRGGVVSSLLIPEPWNTGGFLIAGFLVGGALLGIEWVRWRIVEGRMGAARELASLQAMDPDNFEQLIGDFFKHNGHFAKVVGMTGDHGVDLEITSAGGEYWVAQCKRYKAQVGEPVLRDFYGAMIHTGASRGFVFITSTFSLQAREWALGKPIELVDGVQLVRLIRGFNTK